MSCLRHKLSLKINENLQQKAGLTHVACCSCPSGYTVFGIKHHRSGGQLKICYFTVWEKLPLTVTDSMQSCLVQL